MKQSSIWYELETKGEYLMERTIVVANQKGGVGKTTTAINLAASLAELGKKVLVVDMDPQGNTTSGLGIDKEQAENTVYELMLEECSVKYQSGSSRDRAGGSRGKGIYFKESNR